MKSQTLQKIFSVGNTTFGNKKYKIMRFLGTKIILSEKDINVVNKDTNSLEKVYGKEFIEIFNEVKPYTMISIEAAYANYKIINYIEDNNIQGDIVECGVWKGGSSMIMAKTLLNRNNTSRKIYMYDTYDGMSEATEEDESLVSNCHAIQSFEAMKKSKNYTYGETNWCQAGLDEVKQNMKSTGYPYENIIFIKGKVEDTIPDTIPPKIAYLRLDTDFYISSKHELVHLYPLLENKGVCLFDDYYYWKGQKTATDEYFQSINQKPLLIKVVNNAICIKI